MGNPLKAIIVDDERLALRKLRAMLGAHPELEVVGEAVTIDDAVDLVNSRKPDVIFLDIQMSGESGFDLLRKVEVAFKVVFVTAFDAYAIRAFEVNALDYLLKPVSPERLALSITRLSRPADNTYKSSKAFEYDDRLFVTSNNRAGFIRISSIKFITAAGVYSEIYTSNENTVLVLKSLREWEERLPDKYFARIHRSVIINTEYVERIERWFNYTYRVHLTGIKKSLAMSRRYAAKLKGKVNRAKRAVE